ncbi:hypothetical protein [Brevibacterium sp. CFH 10365]|uniref:hypothetical protein n=1 Tax=Brevibacterium sp. CFH 10365 TaxID=2585207 RepID=UPI0012667A9B|nr:hypothetical protein [Brevibacterium sp. CFH 10365]
METMTPSNAVFAKRHGLNTDHLDRYTPEGYCPGHYVWIVHVNGERFLMAGDEEGGVITRLFFNVFVDGKRVDVDRRSHDVMIKKLHENPDMHAWKIARNWD